LLGKSTFFLKTNTCFDRNYIVWNISNPPITHLGFPMAHFFPKHWLLSVWVCTSSSTISVVPIDLSGVSLRRRQTFLVHRPQCSQSSISKKTKEELAKATHKSIDCFSFSSSSGDVSSSSNEEDGAQVTAAAGSSSSHNSSSSISSHPRALN
jgi:hypothetical protein